MMRCNSRVNISVSGNDMFDYSAGEPAPDQLTILRALDVSVTDVCFVRKCR
jgi:hypothetical protein